MVHDPGMDSIRAGRHPRSALPAWLGHPGLADCRAGRICSWRHRGRRLHLPLLPGVGSRQRLRPASDGAVAGHPVLAPSGRCPACRRLHGQNQQRSGGVYRNYRDVRHRHRPVDLRSCGALAEPAPEGRNRSARSERRKLADSYSG